MVTALGSVSNGRGFKSLREGEKLSPFKGMHNSFACDKILIHCFNNAKRHVAIKQGMGLTAQKVQPQGAIPEECGKWVSGIQIPTVFSTILRIGNIKPCCCIGYLKFGAILHFYGIKN